MLTDNWIPWNEPDQVKLKQAAERLSSQATSLTPKSLLQGIRHAADHFTNWDQAAQACLALAAIADREIQVTPARADELRPLVDALRDAVQFPTKLDKGGEAHYYDSPHDFSPSRFRKAMEALLENLNDG